jgi:signal transduction histidine kinase
MSYDKALFLVDLAAAFWNGLLAAILFALHTSYRRSYLLDWGKSWLAAAASGLAAGLSLQQGAALSPLGRFVLVTAWMTGCYWQALWLITGASTVSTGLTTSRRLTLRLAFLAAALAVVITYLSADWPTAPRFAVRTALSYTVVVVAFAAAAGSVLRGSAWRRELGRAMVGLGFLFQGVLRAAGIAAVAVTWGQAPSGTALEPFFYLALADFMVFAFLGLGMVVWLLEEQRGAAQRAGALAALGTLVAGVAHEARNPLFGLTATLDAFEAGRGRAEEHQRFVRGMRASLLRLQHLMEQLLDLGRPAARRGKVTLGDVLREAVAITEPQAASAGVRVQIAAASALPTLVIDRERMIQVFRNLIENSLQHSPQGGGVELSATRVDEAHVEVRVEDAGPGFPSDDLAQVFDPFFTRRRGGTGLGLAIARRIVEEHGGSIAAGNRSAGGARVVVRLPAA